MRSRAEFAFAQTRLQARHGERLTDADWRALESAQSPDRYLEQARATSLRRFVARIGAGMDSHAIERALRAEARAYVDEVAAWAPVRWRPAVAWLRHAPDAPLIDGLRRGASLQSWMRADAALAPVVGDDGVSRTTTDRMDEWRRLWPKDAAHCATLARLAETVSIELARAAQENARPELARLFIRAIRAHPATPAALVAHIGLTFLDLERLRGGMTRRALFASDDGSAAA